MPVTSDSFNTRIACGTCGIVIMTPDGNVRDATAPGAGLVRDYFRYSSRRGTFVNHCRSCERARRAERNRNQDGRRNRAIRAMGRVLGANRRYGVELELIFPRSTNAGAVEAELTRAGLRGWRVKYDGSLSSGGLEVVSPILEGEEGYEQIRVATRVLRGLGARPDRSCGLHVHHEIRDLTIEGVRATARGWYTQQHLLDGLVSPSRRGGNTYCRHLDETDLRYLDTARDLRSIRTSGRYKTFNLAAYGRYGTVEIRQHQGTCDAEKVITWIQLGKAVIDATVAGNGEPLVQRAEPRVRDMLAAMGEHLNETARTFLLGRAVEFGAVAV